jgi:hypothetical protein
VSGELNDENINAQVDKAVADSQQLDDWKQRVTADLAAEGYDVEGATVMIAHTLDGAPRIDNLGEIRGDAADED